MTRVVFKYELEFGGLGGQGITMPSGADIVMVGLDPQRVPCVWAEHLIDEAQMVVRKFFIFGTGHDITNDSLIHRGSFMDNVFVWHLYEEGEEIVT